jgi:adenine phosphoribosyltransferase
VESTIERARHAFFRQFVWNGGHADVWRVFDDGDAFAAVVEGLVEPWQSGDVTKVCGVESRGFLLGGAAAVALGVGFVAIRKRGALFPGMKHEIESDPDYRGMRHGLQIQQESVRPGDRLLLVDDWVERGSQASAAQELVQACGGVLVGVAVVVDQLTEQRRDRLPPVTSLVTSAELPSYEVGDR